MPRADDVPSFKVGTKVTPCTHNPLGAKGCGEAGAIGAPAALMNAVHDALARAGVKHLDMPASPHRVWSAIQSATDVSNGRHDHVRIRTDKRQDGRRRGRARSRKSGGKALAGGQSLVAAMKLRLAQPGTLVDLVGHRGAARASSSEGDAHRDRRDDAPRGRRRVGGGARARFRRWRRWPRASAIARCATWARSAARSPTTIRRPTVRAAVLALGATVHTNKRKIAADDFFKGNVRNGARRRRDHHGGELSGAEEGGLREVPESRVALRAGRRVRRADGHGACASRSPARRRRVFRAKPLEDALAKTSPPMRRRACQDPAEGLNTDMHGSPEYRAHLVPVLASRAVRQPASWWAPTLAERPLRRSADHEGVGDPDGLVRIDVDRLVCAAGTRRCVSRSHACPAAAATPSPAARCRASCRRRRSRPTG